MIKVITLQEPWASLIGEGIKTIETRSWPCYQYGELYIHAGKAKIPKADLDAMEAAKLLSGRLHYGEILAKCHLSDCILIDEHYASTIKNTDPDCYRCGDFTSGRYAWILTNIVPIAPIPTTGKLGIWYYSSEVG